MGRGRADGHLGQTGAVGAAGGGRRRQMGGGSDVWMMAEGESQRLGD